MKSTIKYVAVAAMALLFASCSDDDNNAAQANTFGDAEVYFDNGVAGDALILGNTYTNSNGEALKIERLNYIVSNFVLIDENGIAYTYPKEESYFVISEEADRLTVHLENIPAGNYKQVKFGIGVDNQRYLQGETAQQSFWDLASQHDLTWTWSTGYKFILFEGVFTTLQATGEKGFMVHQGSNSSTDNYREITLNLPTTARVRPDALPSIHIKSDINVLLDGTNKISLFANLNPAQTSAGIMGGENLIKIAANSLSMFTVDHVHNGSGSPH